MPFLQTVRDRAALVIAILATIVAVGLSPFTSGLLGAAVLYVVFVRPYRWLERVSKPGIAATAVLVAALLLIALPVTWLIGMLIHQAPDALHQLLHVGQLQGRAGTPDRAVLRHVRVCHQLGRT